MILWIESHPCSQLPKRLDKENQEVKTQALASYVEQYSLAH